MYLVSGFNASGLPPALASEINFNQVDFVGNDQLREFLGKTNATPAQIEAGVRINEEARLNSLKTTFLIIAVISLLAIIPALGLPKYAPGSLSSQEIIQEEKTDYEA